MDVRASETPDGADAVIVALESGTAPRHAALAPLLERGEARTRAKAAATAHDERGRPVIGVGLGDTVDAEAVRVAAAVAHGRALETGARHVAWLGPAEHAAPAVEGIVLASYRYKADDDGGRAIERLDVVGAEAGAVRQAGVVAHAVNRARALVDAPPNVATPTALAHRARGIPGVTTEVLDRAAVEARGLGAFAAVARGSRTEPAIVVATYAGSGGPVLGLVGKAVTFDSGGYSMKPAASMPNMKQDMGGGAAVLEALAAIAELELPCSVVAVVGACDNRVSGDALLPGEVVTAGDGTTIEVTNTDAEGRLVLADCLLVARERGAQRLVDIATLTGGVGTALGNVHAGLLGTDDDWVDTVRAAGEAAGDRCWPLPMHPDYEPALESRVADVINANLDRKAQPVTAAHFLARFAGELPWAHVDSAGVNADRGKPYAQRGASGFGVRLLVELARRA